VIVWAAAARREDVVQYAVVELQRYFTEQSPAADSRASQRRTRSNNTSLLEFTCCLASYRCAHNPTGQPTMTQA